ncbi:type II toxin-antitoxin system RelE family toxin [Thermococcus thermotolerans]|uniref:type II toxin-antitoxin system RelE family toxin n=1 Tax=Thermococcus thermotolerans TaxID=2969672 RepID=UPI0021575621|nr:type II toxin-antitoxin system RelE/ParE family toxin [Thermococcus thermotolerans]
MVAWGYQVIISKDVVKNAKKYLKSGQRRKPAEFLKSLEENPFPKPPFDVKPVKGAKRGVTSTYRFRIGDYRLFYTVFWDEKIIIVTDLRPRERAYH